MFDKGICEKSSVKLSEIASYTFFKQIIQYSDITPGS
ncbi:hypothetical protein T01_13723 [Trichinella spiralis]|uniref:Uncharacterized protein n=1 Tax=Trichinella spiralis TaxID=6334 RepID=A0A0V1AL29_TRISP|nr:hypothetical protein T01_1289 [Trichinella spiralis]KRY25447.1 hypothetical protein T01_1923 [Trichinella spiralis]KRY25944.1 hypothetical protein T01_13723 [Trichinella spiralis]